MNKMNRNKSFFLVCLTLVIMLGGILRGDAVMTVQAELESAFSIWAEMQPSDKRTYDVRVTVENQGADWEGNVRLVVDEDYRRPCAYDTALSLPQGSRKQFVVKVPVDSIDNTNGTVIISLLDRKDKEIVSKEFKRLLAGEMDALSMGILSDAYAGLTYLDMGGDEIYFYNNLYPIRLVELQQDNLADTLDALTFLVIDQYNTGILTEEELKAIEVWNSNGGILIIGTGAYAEDTLRGFDNGYLNIRCKEIHSPGDTSGYVTSNYGAGTYVDWSQLTMAEVQGMSNTYADYYTGGWSESMGNGSVCVLPYSLTELGGVKDFYREATQEDFVMQILENVCNYASSRYSTSSTYYGNYISYIRRLLGVVGNTNSILNFGVLRGIVIVYVIFVGPVLYLILRMLKRRELYWIAVPVTALLGIGVIFFAGRGFEVVSTKVYSVTVKNLSGNGKSGTYLQCYDANRREWNLRLAEGCEYVGPMSSSSSYGGSNDESYYHHIKKEGDIFSVGILPNSNFEDSYFYLSSTKNGESVEGRLLVQDVTVDWTGFRGTVINNTNQDMDYFAVLRNDSMYVYEDLPAGASCNLEDMVPLYTASGYSYGSYIYSFLDDYYDDREYGKASALAALGVGIFDVYPQAEQCEAIVIGVVEDWDKIVDDNCSEISYGCLYSVQ